MIELDEARLIAERAIADEQENGSWQLADQVAELPHHWIFSYNTVDYYTSGNPFAGLAGNGPIAVSKANGEVAWLRGGQPPEEQLN